MDVFRVDGEIVFKAGDKVLVNPKGTDLTLTGKYTWNIPDTNLHYVKLDSGFKRLYSTDEIRKENEADHKN